MIRYRLLLLATLMLAPVTASAADVPVSYDVDAVALKVAVSGTPLTFQLYTDASCTAPVHAEAIAIDDVTRIAILKRFRARNGLKPPKTAEIRATLTNVPAATPLYLQVTGTGITPVGVACQVQQATIAGSPGPALVVKDANGTLLGPLDIAAGTVTLSDGGTPVAAFALPSGFAQGTAFYYTSTDCSGTKLTLQGFVWLRTAIGFDGTTLYYTPASTPSTTLNSSDYSPEIAGNCTGSGKVFVPPDRCCCTSPGCFTPLVTNAGAASTLDVSGFVPPFHTELQ
jgi:hypothetical protein